MQLRSAKKFGFDFETHSGDKVGVIRTFVRKKKEEERRRISNALATEKDSKSDLSSAKPKTISSRMEGTTEVSFKEQASEKGDSVSSSTRRCAKRGRKVFKPKVEKVPATKQIFKTSQSKA